MDNKIVRDYTQGRAFKDIAHDLKLTAGIVRIRYVDLTRKRKVGNRSPLVVEDSASSCSSSSEEEDEEEGELAHRKKKSRLDPPSHLQAALTL